MKIENRTEYRTREVRRVLTAVHNHLARDEGRLRTWKRLVVTIRYTRNRTSSGHARLDGSSTLLRIRRPGDRTHRLRRERNEQVWEASPAPAAQVRDLVAIAWHEFLHLYGYRHSAMARYFPDGDEIESMARDAGFDPSDVLPRYEESEPAEPSEIEKRTAELRAALAKRKEWTTKAKLAKTKLAKYRSREMAARRKLEVLGVDPEPIAEDELGGYEPAMAGEIKIR